MRYEIYDYEVLYFDKDYKDMKIQYVVDKIVDPKNAETKFVFIKELDKNNKAIFGSIILPYAVVTKIHVLNFYLDEESIVKRYEEQVESSHYSISYSRSNTKRFFKVKARWR